MQLATLAGGTDRHLSSPFQGQERCAAVVAKASPPRVRGGGSVRGAIALPERGGSSGGRKGCGRGADVCVSDALSDLADVEKLDATIDCRRRVGGINRLFV